MLKIKLGQRYIFYTEIDTQNRLFLKYLFWIEKARTIPETILFMPIPTEKEMLDNWKYLLQQRQKELEKF
jgi:hypothetical protein